MNGNLSVPEFELDPYATENLLDPYPTHHTLHEAGPVVRSKAYGTLLVRARHANVHAVFSDHARFSSAAGVSLTNFNLEKPLRPPSLILEAGPTPHTKNHAALSRILSTKTVTTIRATFVAEAGLLIDRCLAKVKLMAFMTWRSLTNSRFFQMRWD